MNAPQSFETMNTPGVRRMERPQAADKAPAATGGARLQVGRVQRRGQMLCGVAVVRPGGVRWRASSGKERRPCA